MKKIRFTITRETIREAITAKVDDMDGGFIRIPCEELRDDFIDECVALAELDAERRYHSDDYPIPDYESIVLDTASLYGYSI